MPDNLTAEWAQELADAYREEVKRVADERRPADLPAEYAELADAHFEEEVAREWEGEIDELADETSWQVEALKAYERALDRRPLRVGRLIRRARQSCRGGRRRPRSRSSGSSDDEGEDGPGEHARRAADDHVVDRRIGRR